MCNEKINKIAKKFINPDLTELEKKEYSIYKNTKINWRSIYDVR